MALVTSADWPEVRALLDAQLTPNDLKDAVIAADAHAGRAQREVLGRITNAQALVDADGDDGKRVKLAVKCLIAASLAPVVVRLTSVQVSGRDGAYSRQTFDPTKRAAELRAQAEEQIAEVLKPSEVASRTYALPITFRAARGTRGL
jgi:hypothetical protein